MKREVYYRGKPGKKYGIWNDVKKQFQFGICEDTPDAGRSPALSEAGRRCEEMALPAPDVAGQPQIHQAANISAGALVALAQMGRNAHGGRDDG